MKIISFHSFAALKKDSRFCAVPFTFAGYSMAHLLPGLQLAWGWPSKLFFKKLFESWNKLL
jgi:hypothetical protein